jgi:hypothetical protein
MTPRSGFHRSVSSHLRMFLRLARIPCALAVLLGGGAGRAGAQSEEPCDVRLSGADFVGPSADLARMMDLQQPQSGRSFLMRRISDRVVLDACMAPGAVTGLARSLSLPVHPERGSSVLPADLRVHYNGTYPRDWNDGAMRGGAGLSTGLTAGASLRWGGLEASLAPVFTWYGNAASAIIPFADPATYSQYIHPWHGRFIDLPQRFGSKGSSGIDAGQSYVRMNTAGVRAGVSHENLAWGPARRNPLLLSGTAPGFAHVFVESARPHNVWLGAAEFQLFWGRLEESDYFDYDPDNDRRALAGVLATLRPKGLNGLYLGAGHLHMQTWSANTSASDLLLGPYTGLDADSSGLPRDLRLFTLFLRWASAPGGLEVYGEWARQDSWEQWVRLLYPIDAAQAYTLGLQKITRRGETAIRFSAEVSHLSDALAHPDLGRGLNTYYVSPHVPQGHTHRGQLLGAPIGPGSESQFIGTDVFWRHGRSSVSVERVRYDDDAYYAVWAQVHGPHGHDTEMSFRAAHLFARPRFSVEAEVGYSFRYSRSLLGLHHSNHADFPYRRDENIGIRVAGRMNPPSWTWTR